MRILIIIQAYLPGYKAGGPIRTITNLVERLGSEFDFDILTTDRDLGDAAPYPNIEPEFWYAHNKYHVYYLSFAHWQVSFLHSAINFSDYDIIYMNSFFAQSTRAILQMKIRGLIPSEIPIILAPRGELSPGAYTRKSWKKKPYTFLFRALGLHRQVSWQASSPYEKQDIESIHGDNIHVYVAPDMPPILTSQDDKADSRTKKTGQAKLIFLSRIVPKKNLLFALETLKDIQSPIQFDIYGPLEDAAYWKLCQKVMREQPGNITAVYRGVLNPKDVCRIIAQYDCMFFPTLSENFGHVILESFMAARPAILSDQTPWRNLQAKQAGWDIALEDREAFRRAVQHIADLTAAEIEILFKGARSVAETFANDETIINANRDLFYQVAKSGNHIHHI